MDESERDFAADVRSHVDVFLIPKYANNMPFRLIDTYTGLIFERSEVVSLLKTRRDYRAKLEVVIREAEHLAILINPESPSQHAELNHLDAFIAEYLAFAMFSHRWRGQEPTLDDVRKAAGGIYSMKSGVLAEENPKVFRLPKDEVSDLPSGVEKLQEFCCLAAKCGFRWAWSDTCCINKKDYAETSESINCMFLWYRSSYLTIVYLDDVDDVEEGRLPAVESGDCINWFEDLEIREPLSPSYSPASGALSDTYLETLTTAPYLSLHHRLHNGGFPELRTMHPDTQVERPYLETHLNDNFPNVNSHEVKGRYRKLPVWVTRGWTLQEMLASKRLRFYNKRWTLLEEADDYDTDEAEENIFFSSSKYRARLVDHRANDLWSEALKRATDVPIEDLVNFRVGTRDVRSRLCWAAQRTTTKVEDMAYCLLGIFDISLPAMYGEGNRAFFRLQEEIMKRTGDVSLFDWRGRSSSVNSFLAYGAECFIQPNLPDPVLEDSTDSPPKMIIRLICTLTTATVSGAVAAFNEVKDWIGNTTKSPPPGHTLVNGGLNISLFEHRVRRCECLANSTLGDAYVHYKLEVDGLQPTTVTFASRSSGLVDDPAQYYLCRVWNQDTHSVFRVLLDLLEYAARDIWDEILSMGDDDGKTEGPSSVTEGEEDSPESKLREDIQMKRREVLKFFKAGFPVYLVHVKDGRRVRVNTLKRVVAEYTKFDFRIPVVTRLIL